MSVTRLARRSSARKNGDARRATVLLGGVARFSDRPETLRSSVVALLAPLVVRRTERQSVLPLLSPLGEKTRPKRGQASGEDNCVIAVAPSRAHNHTAARRRSRARRSRGEPRARPRARGCEEAERRSQPVQTLSQVDKCGTPTAAAAAAARPQVRAPEALHHDVVQS